MCVFRSLSVRRPSTVALAYLLFVLPACGRERTCRHRTICSYTSHKSTQSGSIFRFPKMSRADFAMKWNAGCCGCLRKIASSSKRGLRTARCSLVSAQSASPSLRSPRKLVRTSFAPYSRIRAQLRPGQFVGVRILGASRPNSILVPQRAVQQGNRKIDPDWVDLCDVCEQIVRCRQVRSLLQLREA